MFFIFLSSFKYEKRRNKKGPKERRECNHIREHLCLKSSNRNEINTMPNVLVQTSKQTEIRFN